MRPLPLLTFHVFISAKDAKSALSTSTPYGFETIRVDPEPLTATFAARDGTPIRCRLIQPDDAPLLIGLFARLSQESRRRRFNLPLANIEPERVVQEARRLADVDNRTNGGALLAFAESAGETELIGVARLGRAPEKSDSPTAEVALVVLLAVLARRMAVETFTASVQADNETLFALFHRLQLPLKRHTTHGETTIALAVADIPAPQSHG